MIRLKTIFLIITALLLTSCDLFRSKKPSVIFLLLDTLRADHLSAYGYERATTPILDSLAKESLFFKYAITAAPWTPPSVSSIITGLYPSAHGMMPPNDRERALETFNTLSKDTTTWAEIMKANGYLTGGATSNPWTQELFGFNQGYDEYYFRNRAKAEEITKAGIKLLDKFIKEDAPFFLYLHYLDPHDPYDPPGDFRNKFSGDLRSRKYGERESRFINLYDGEIAYLDSQLGILFEYLRKLKIYDDVIIVAVGDHGEQFMEHGSQGHGHDLYNEELHVPLMIKSKLDPRTIDFTVSTVDILPTVLDLVGIAIPPSLPGISLTKDENSRDRSGVFSEIYRKKNHKAFTSFDGEKIIMDFSMDAPFGKEPDGTVVGVFDRNRDERELTPLDDATLTSRMQNEFNRALAVARQNSVKGDHKVQLGNDAVEQLKSLGYLQ